MEKDFDTWNILKKQVDHSDVSEILIQPRELWWLHIGINIGCEIDGKNSNFERPVLVYKKITKETILVIPLSSKMRNDFLNRPLRYNGITGTLKYSQIKIVSVKRIIRKIGKISQGNFADVRKNFIEIFG